MLIEFIYAIFIFIVDYFILIINYFNTKDEMCNEKRILEFNFVVFPGLLVIAITNMILDELLV